MVAFSHFLRFYVCDDVALQRQSSMRCSSRCQQRFLGHTDSSGIAWPRHHIRHVFFGFYNHLIDVVEKVSSATISARWRTRNVQQCVSYLYSRTFFTRGSSALPLFFLCNICARWEQNKTRFDLPNRSQIWRRKVGMKRLCGKGTFLLSQKFFRKMGVPTFFQAHEGWKFFALSLVLQASWLHAPYCT